MKTLRTLAAAGCCLAALSGSFASSSQAAVAPRDHHFMVDAAQGGMAEVMLGQLAQRRATDPQVKNFGARMVTDHSKANSDLMHIAAVERVRLPKSPNAEQKATYRRLSRLSGTRFDKEYMRAMVADHNKDAAAFNDEAQNGKDRRVTAFASRYLPIIEMHRGMAKDTLKAGVGMSRM